MKLEEVIRKRNKRSEIVENIREKSELHFNLHKNFQSQVKLEEDYLKRLNEIIEHAEKNSITEIDDSEVNLINGAF